MRQRTGTGAEPKPNPALAEKQTLQPLPDDLRSWILEARANTAKQLMVLPPEELEGPGYVAELATDDLSKPAWLGYPYTGAGKATRLVKSEKGATSYEPYISFEPRLTIKTNVGEVSFEIVGVDIATKCGIYVVEGVYDLSDVAQPVMITERVPGE